jgi:hypothetical protein
MSAEQSIEAAAQERAREAIESDPVFGELLGLLGEPAAAAVEASIAQPSVASSSDAASVSLVQASTAAARLSAVGDNAVSPTVSDDGFAYEEVEAPSDDSDDDESESATLGESSRPTSTTAQARPSASQSPTADKPNTSRSLFARDKKRAADAVAVTAAAAEPADDPEDPMTMARQLMDEIQSSSDSLEAGNTASASTAEATQTPRERYAELSAKIFRKEHTPAEEAEAQRLAQTLEQQDSAAASASKVQAAEAKQRRASEQQKDTQLSAVGIAKVLESGDTRLHFKARGQLGIKFGKDAGGHCIINSLVQGGLAESMCKAHGVSILGGERLVYVGDVEVFAMISAKATEVLKAAAVARPLILTFRQVAMMSPRKSPRQGASARSSITSTPASATKQPRKTDLDTRQVSAADQAHQDEMKAEIATLQALLARRTRENDELAEKHAALAESSKQNEQQAEVLGQAQQVASVLQTHLSKLDMENEELRAQLQQVEGQSAEPALEVGMTVRVVSDSEHSGREGTVQAIASETATVVFEVDDAVAEADSMNEISVVCPEGVQAGDPIVITTADGEDLDVVLPPGVSAGEEFTVSSPAKPRAQQIVAEFARDELEVVDESGGASDDTPKQGDSKKKRKAAAKRFDPSGWKSQQQRKEEALEKKREEEEAEMKLLAEQSLHKGKSKINRGQADASANKLSRWTKRKAPAESSEPDLNPLQGSFEKSLSSRAPRVPAADSATKTSPLKKIQPMRVDQLEAQLSGLPEKVQSHVLERLRNEELLGFEVRKLKRERDEWKQQGNLARSWQEHYQDLVEQLTLLAGGRLSGEVEADDGFLGKQCAEQQVAAIDRIRKDTRAAKKRISHYQTQLSKTIKTKETNETILHEMVNDSNVSAAGFDPGSSPGGGGGGEEGSLQSQIAHLKRTLKAREKMDRTARIVSAEAAVELNEMRDKLEVAEHTASMAREQVRNAREQQRMQFDKMHDAQNELHRTSDIVQKKCDDIKALKDKNARLEDQIEFMGQDSKSQRPRFMRDKKGNGDEVKRLRDELHNSTSQRQILEKQLERARLNIKRLERELEGSEIDFSATGGFSNAAPERFGAAQPFSSPSMSGGLKADSRRVSWHADDVEETLEYERGSKPVLSGRRETPKTSGSGSSSSSRAEEEQGDYDYYRDDQTMMTPEEAKRKEDRRRQMAAKMAELGSAMAEEEERAAQDELGHEAAAAAHGEGEEDEDDFLAQATRIRDGMHNTGGGGGRGTASAGARRKAHDNPEDLERYRDRERENNLARLEAMWEGCTVLKHSTSRGRSKSRHLQLSHDTTQLTLGKTTSKQATTTVPLDDIVQVHFGSRSSPGFQARAMLLHLDDWHCFSLECASGDFVDISTTCDEDSENWCIGLRAIVDRQNGVSLGHRLHPDPWVYRAQQFLWQRATMKATDRGHDET